MPRTSGQKTVLLFGLSADPPTGMGGHAGLVAWGARQPDIDEVWVLPVFRHAFSEKRQMTPFEHRLAMAKLAFEHLPDLEGRVHVLTTEKEVTESGTVTGLVGTLDVVTWLRQHHPSTRFAVLMGGDTYRDYCAGLWKGGRQLELEARIVAVPRVGVNTAGTVPGPALNDVSSRALRASADPALWRREVQPSVLDYIRQHHLYAIS